MSTIRLVGLDFGTTTSGCVIASATLMHNAVSGRRELAEIREDFRSDLVFTPFDESGLDAARLQKSVDGWLTAGNVRPDEVFGGGALLTGLAAREGNAAALVEIIRSRLGDALVATADDPCLEAWLALQAGAAGLSKLYPDRWVINLDIGGGTSNIALGKAGDVMRTGSLFVGARHVQLAPGTYRITRLSDFASRLFAHLGIVRSPGEVLEPAEVEAVLNFYLNLLEAAVTGDQSAFDEPIGRLHQQVAFDLPADVRDPIVTVSGGVGELVYGHLAGKPLASTTSFGDLGIDLAKRLLESPRWSAHFAEFQPACAGRATVYGLLLHTTQISGSTLYLPEPAILPLRNLPILGRLEAKSTEGQIRDILQLVARSPQGGCLQVVATGGASVVAELGEKIASALCAINYPVSRPLVLLVEENVGKALGQYVTRWGSLPLKLLVLDEIAIRDARYIQIGNLRDQVVPVSFYGMN